MLKKTNKFLLAAVLLACAASQAWAGGLPQALTGSTKPNSALTSGQQNGHLGGFLTAGNNKVGLDSALAYHSAMHANSSTVIGAETLRAGAAHLIDLVSAHVDSRKETSTGEGKVVCVDNRRFGLWGRAGWTNIRDTNEQQNWHGDLYTAVIGADYKFNDIFLGGMALNYSFLNAITAFNEGKEDANSFGLTPYVMAQVNKNVGFEALFNYSWVTRKDTRKNLRKTLLQGLADSSTAPRNDITASPKSDRMMGGIFVNLGHIVNKTRLGLKLGYVYAQDKKKAFKENGVGGLEYKGEKDKVQMIDVRGRVGYNLGAVEPYVHINYAYDLKKATKNSYGGEIPDSVKDKFEEIKNVEIKRHTYGGGIGINFKANDCWGGDASFTYLKQGKITSNSVHAKLRYVF